MSPDEKIARSLENFKTVFGQKHNLYAQEKNRIMIELEKFSTHEEKITYLLNEQRIAEDTKQFLEEENEKKSFADRLNSFSEGELAVEELIKFIKTQIYLTKGFIFTKEADKDDTTVLSGEGKLDLTEQLLLISYLQDGGHFIKRKSHQTEKNIQDLICLLLNKGYESLKSKVQVINEIKNGRITKSQARHKIQNLNKIKNIFLTISDKATFDTIVTRINELEKIANT